MLDRIEGIEISSGLGIKLSAAQFKPICHKLTAEETRKNFQREQVFACCIAYLIMCTENLAALYESSSEFELQVLRLFMPIHHFLMGYF